MAGPRNHESCHSQERPLLGNALAAAPKAGSSSGSGL